MRRKDEREDGEIDGRYSKGQAEQRWDIIWGKIGSAREEYLSVVLSWRRWSQHAIANRWS
jgi:hypothetical protein